MVIPSPEVITLLLLSLFYMKTCTLPEELHPARIACVGWNAFILATDAKSSPWNSCAN